MENKNNNLPNPQDQNTQIIRLNIEALFEGDSYGLFVFQKTERLVRAVYLLTSLMSDKEPMRERARTLSNEMLECSFSMSDRIWGEETYQKNLLFTISELLTLLDIAENIKMLSKMNHQIITSELRKLADFMITSSVNYSSAKIAFETNLFDGDYNYIPDQTFPTSKIDNNPINNVSLKDNVSANKGQNNVSDTVINTTNDKMSLNKTTPTVKDKNNRQEIILSMLKSGVKLTIKDFAKNIKDCSEKTIQRELSSLVSKGVLKKEGERRWSKYFIAK